MDTMTPIRRRFAKSARAIVAIAAAYAFVLQVLLLSLTASQAAAADPGANPYVICFGAGNDAGADTQSGQNPTKIHCSLLCAQTMSAAAPAPSATMLGFVFDHGSRLEAASTPRPSIPSSPSPKLSQGPPQTA